MKKLLTALFLLVFCSQVLAAPKIGNVLRSSLYPYVHGGNWLSSTAIDSDGDKLGFLFYAETTSDITDVDFYMDITGDVTGITWQVAIYSDSGGVPNTALSGVATFAGLAADGWTGLKTFATDTGALTVGTPYWFVLDETTGTPDASNRANFRYRSNNGKGFDTLRHHNGTDWTTTAAVNKAMLGVVFKHADGTYSGYGLDGAAGSSGLTDIYSTNKQGILCKFGSQTKIVGCSFSLDKVGTPGNLTVRVYESSTEKYSTPAKAVGDVQDADLTSIVFSSPVLVAADTNIYIVFEQDGTSNENDYDFITLSYPTAYKEVVFPVGWGFVYGSGSDPTAFTVNTTKLPIFEVWYSDTTTEFDQAGGTSNDVFGIM